MADTTDYGRTKGTSVITRRKIIGGKIVSGAGSREFYKEGRLVKETTKEGTPIFRVQLERRSPTSGGGIASTTTEGQTSQEVAKQRLINELQTTIDPNQAQNLITRLSAIDPKRAEQEQKIFNQKTSKIPDYISSALGTTRQTPAVRLLDKGFETRTQSIFLPNLSREQKLKEARKYTSREIKADQERKTRLKQLQDYQTLASGALQTTPDIKISRLGYQDKTKKQSVSLPNLTTEEIRTTAQRSISRELLEKSKTKEKRILPKIKNIYKKSEEVVSKKLQLEKVAKITSIVPIILESGVKYDTKTLRSLGVKEDIINKITKPREYTSQVLRKVGEDIAKEPIKNTAIVLLGYGLGKGAQIVNLGTKSLQAKGLLKTASLIKFGGKLTSAILLSAYATDIIIQGKKELEETGQLTKTTADLIRELTLFSVGSKVLLKNKNNKSIKPFKKALKEAKIIDSTNKILNKLKILFRNKRGEARINFKELRLELIKRGADKKTLKLFDNKVKTIKAQSKVKISKKPEISIEKVKKPRLFKSNSVNSIPSEARPGDKVKIGTNLYNVIGKEIDVGFGQKSILLQLQKIKVKPKIISSLKTKQKTKIILKQQTIQKNKLKVVPLIKLKQKQIQQQQIQQQTIQKNKLKVVPLIKQKNKLKVVPLINLRQKQQQTNKQLQKIELLQKQIIKPKQQTIQKNKLKVVPLINLRQKQQQTNKQLQKQKRKLKLIIKINKKKVKKSIKTKKLKITPTKLFFTPTLAGDIRLRKKKEKKLRLYTGIEVRP